MVLYSNPSEKKLDENSNTKFTPAETKRYQFFLKGTSYPTFATPFCNGAVC